MFHVFQLIYDSLFVFGQFFGLVGPDGNEQGIGLAVLIIGIVVALLAGFIGLLIGKRRR
jgi:hypothetical protein